SSISDISVLPGSLSCDPPAELEQYQSERPGPKSSSPRPFVSFPRSAWERQLPTLCVFRLVWLPPKWPTAGLRRQGLSPSTSVPTAGGPSVCRLAGGGDPAAHAG